MSRVLEIESKLNLERIMETQTLENLDCCLHAAVILKIVVKKCADENKTVVIDLVCGDVRCISRSKNTRARTCCSRETIAARRRANSSGEPPIGFPRRFNSILNCSIFICATMTRACECPSMRLQKPFAMWCACAQLLVCGTSTSGTYVRNFGSVNLDGGGVGFIAGV